MPLILLTGYPSSGLTYRANQLTSHFKIHQPSTSANFSIQHISDDTLGIPRSAYDTARTEKDARATLSSAIKRHLGRETLVIADAMNYIKGFRYQMWCEAKAVGTGCCVVHVAANPEQAKALHDRRIHTDDSTKDTVQDDSLSPQEPPAYASNTFDNLISRYEEPSASARWDSPLFTVPYSDTDPPYEAIAAALFSTGSKGFKPKKEINAGNSNSSQQSITSKALSSLTNSASASNPPDTTTTTTSPDATESGIKTGKFIKPHLATVAPRQMSADALYILEKCTSDIVKTILQHITTAEISECAGETIQLSDTDTNPLSNPSTLPPEDHDEESESNTLKITLPQTGTLSVAHLQRLKRQFVSLYRSRGVGMGAASSAGTGGLGGGELGSENVSRAFVRFLQSAFDGE